MATHSSRLITAPGWLRSGRLWFSITLPILLLLTACGGTNAPSRRGQLAQRNQLVQPLALAEIYGATPAVAGRAGVRPSGEVSAADAIQQGEQLFVVNCAPCHQANGEGNLNRFPALNNNALVTAQSPEPLIETVFYGRGVMPAFAPTLDNVELAAVLSYIRNAWDNGASVITPKQVNAVYTAAPASQSMHRKEVGPIAQRP